MPRDRYQPDDDDGYDRMKDEWLTDGKPYDAKTRQQAKEDWEAGREEY